MFCGKLLSFVALAICWLDTEAKLEVFLDDCWFENVDPEYVGYTESSILDDSNDESSVKLNVTIIKEIPVESMARLVLLGESMGEYVLPTGIDFEMTLCDGFNEPVIVGPFIGALGLTGKDCPIKPGNYGSKGYIVPTDGFPDEFPPNKYKATFDIELEGKGILTATGERCISIESASIDKKSGYVLDTEGFAEQFPPNKYKATFEMELEKEMIISAMFLISVV